MAKKSFPRLSLSFTSLARLETSQKCQLAIYRRLETHTRSIYRCLRVAVTLFRLFENGHEVAPLPLHLTIPPLATQRQSISAHRSAASLWASINLENCAFTRLRDSIATSLPPIFTRILQPHPPRHVSSRRVQSDHA